jgi:hypothetical protein
LRSDELYVSSKLSMPRRESLIRDGWGLGKKKNSLIIIISSYANFWSNIKRIPEIIQEQLTLLATQKTILMLIFALSSLTLTLPPFLCIVRDFHWYLETGLGFSIPLINRRNVVEFNLVRFPSFSEMNGTKFLLLLSLAVTLSILGSYKRLKNHSNVNLTKFVNFSWFKNYTRKLSRAS